MNFAGPFVSEPSHVSPVSLGGDGFTFKKPGFIQHNPSDSHVVIPDAHLLFSGDYTRIGNDLIISGDGQKLVVGNYFKGETRPALTSKDGATLAGHVVDALTGHVHYAQANATAPAAGQVIGNVLKLSGSATAIRNGVSIELHIGDAIQKGDVIQTGSDSSIGMTFVDGSAFGMTSNARMVMNEMIYDPNGSSNSSLISLVQGTITFVAGQTAKNGNMRVETPVATMGIRGTAVLVEIGANDGPTKFSVLVEPDGHTGSYNLYDKATGQLIGTVSQAGQVTFVTSLGLGQPPSAIEQLKTLADQQAEKAIIQQVFQLYFPNYNPDDSNPKSPKFGHNTSGNNLAEIIFTTNSNAQQTFLTQIELRFAVTDPITGITTYQNKIFYNAKAAFSANSVFVTQAFVPTTESFKFADVVKIDDPDIGNAPFYDIGVPFVAGSAIIKSAVSTIPQVSETFLKSLLTINQTTGLVSFDRQQFNFLDDGQTVTFKIQVTATSGPDTGIVEIPVTITGENDAPTIVVGTATTVAGGVKEDVAVTSGHIGTNGTITFQDFDLTDAHSATVALTSTASGLPHFVAGTEIGYFTIDPVAENLTDTNNQGTVGWHFTVDDDDPTLQSLAEGQTITQIYTITITDNNGVSVTQTVTITITGTNDTPVLAADTSVHQADEVVNTTNSSVEDVVNGSLSFTDVDLSDTHTATAALNTDVGSIVWSGGSVSGIPSATLMALVTAMKTTVTDSTGSGAGSVAWEFKLPDHLFDFLAEGETLTLTYDVTVTDNNGVSSTRQVTVQVGAANDQPVISVISNSSALQEDAGVQPGNLLTDSGSVTFTDTDLTDTHTAHVTFNNAAGGNGASVSPALLTALGTALSVPSSTLAAGVHTFDWDFALDNTHVQYLAEGETITVTYTITVADSSGDPNATSAGQTVTVVITGTNDTPVIAAVDVAGAVNEDTALEPGNILHDSGSVTFADADATDHETASVAFVGDTTTLAAAIPEGLHTALLSALTLQNGSFTSNTGTINWDFNLDNSLVQYLAEGETITVTYTITVKDDSGTATDTSSTQTVTVVITGTNDAPTVAAALTLATSEGDAPVVRDLLEGASDVDASDTLSVTNIQYSVDTPGGITILQDGHTINVDGANPAFDHLAAGATQEIVVSYDVTDTHGATTAQTETITITGLNDRPVLALGANLTTITEDQTANSGQSVGSFATGISDADDGALKGVAITGYTGQNGHWEYSVDGGSSWAAFGTYSASSGLLLASDDKVRFVPNGENGGTDTLTYVAWDQTSGAHGQTANTALAEHWAAFSQDSQTASLTVTDVNDAAVIGNPPVAEVREGVTDSAGNLVASGTLTISDVDSPATFSTTVTDATGHTNLGTLSLQADGQYVYSVLNSNPGVQALTGAQTHVDVFTVQSQDGTSKDINFTISGVTEIASTSANETLAATPDRDNFVFNSAFGEDTITGFALGSDAMVFDHSLFATVADILAAATSSGSDTIITHGTDTVTLTGISLAQVQAHQNDFHIV